LEIDDFFIADSAPTVDEVFGDLADFCYMEMTGHQISIGQLEQNLVQPSERVFYF
jgi:hypothetical protein